MEIVDRKHHLSFLEGIGDQFRDELLNSMTFCSFSKGHQVTMQYDLGHYFYFMLEGEVRFSIKIDSELEELSVGSSNEENTPIGWSGFREPYRYATTVTCLKDSTFIKWSHEDLRRIISENPKCGIHFIEAIVFKSQLMLQTTRQMLAQNVLDSENTFLDLVPFQTISKSAKKKSDEVLKRSPFFEVFTEDELKFIRKTGTLKTYTRGEKVYSQYDYTDTFDLLLGGRIGLVYSHDAANSKLDKTVIDNEGYIVGSGCFSEDQLNHVSCVSLSNSTVFHLDIDQLKEVLFDHPEVGVKFYLRLLWFISTRLRSARAKLITIKYDGEISAVKNLIEQNCTQLDVLSPLHKIPHLLKNTFTLEDAISKLKEVVTSGSALESRLATSSLKVLSEVIRENDFYNGLSNIYSKVVNVSPNLSHREVRDYCAEEFLNVFEGTNYVVQGEENLPNEASIFIYNHLENHIYNTLPNNFQLTLDSHFISSVLLYKKYNNPGIRVVRVPRGEEYGHQFYYERLGHIPVYTKDSASIIETPDQAKQRRQTFYNTASNYLKEGTSILLAPEGQSFSTGNSPGEFKPGAFYLTTKMEKEPLIVPVAVANFDKRLNRTTFSAVIKEPFRLSDRVEDPSNREEMAQFLKDYQEEYKSYVEEALDLSKGNQWSEIIK